jgi:hypothetical protein
MDDPGPNWGQIAITGRRRESDDFGRSRSDPNLVPGRSFFEGRTADATLCDCPQNCKRDFLTRADLMTVLGWAQQFTFRQSSPNVGGHRHAASAAQRHFAAVCPCGPTS